MPRDCPSPAEGKSAVDKVRGHIADFNVELSAELEQELQDWASGNKLEDLELQGMFAGGAAPAAPPPSASPAAPPPSASPAAPPASTAPSAPESQLPGSTVPPPSASPAAVAAPAVIRCPKRPLSLQEKLAVARNAKQMKTAQRKADEDSKAVQDMS